MMRKELDQTSKSILALVKGNSELSSSDIHSRLETDVQLVTTKRNLSKLVAENLLSTTGVGRGTRYIISPSYKLFYPIDIEVYFEKEIDNREIINRFNQALLDEVLEDVQLFSNEENEQLNALQENYKKTINNLPKSIYQNDLERLAIDLSWKSSQIEDNTYSLLETEALLLEQKEAEGKDKDDATMLLNHKEAIDFLIKEPEYIYPLSLAKIESIHSILINNLGVERNIRRRHVGITGTNYVPLDNEFQIKEAVIQMCILVNERRNIFEKALLLLVLISYIQPFSDGNKRTARIISNAILINHGYCPLSFRTVDSVYYKKTMLLFYEQNNIEGFKAIFMDQYKFAVNTYFK